MKENEIEAPGLLAYALISKGLALKHLYHIRAEETSRKAGLNVLAEQHSRLAEIALSHYILKQPIPQLSDQENVRYIELLEKRFAVSSDGGFIENEVDESEKEEMTKMFIKAYPPKTNEDNSF